MICYAVFGLDSEAIGLKSFDLSNLHKQHGIISDVMYMLCFVRLHMRPRFIVCICP